MSTTANKPKMSFRRFKQLAEYPDAIHHPESNLIFRSAADKTAIGRLIEDEFVQTITPKCVEFCNKNKFKHDPSIVVEEDEEDAEEDEEDAEGTGEEDVENPENNEIPVSDVPKETENIVVPPVDKLNDDEPKITESDSPVFSGDDDFQNENENYSQLLDALLTHRQKSTQRYESKIKSLAEELVNVKNVLEETTNQLNQTAEDFKKLQTKFDMMKSLFS